MSQGRVGLGPSALGFAGGPGGMGSHKTALATPMLSQLGAGVHTGTEHLHPDCTWIL